jgi:hypothetical protein
MVAGANRTLRIAIWLGLSAAACGTASPGAGESGDDSSGEEAESDTGSTTAGESSIESGGDGDGNDGGDGDGGDGDGEAQLCNGYAELCDRTYDQVAFPGTHNANASTAYGYTLFNANHNSTLTEQLEDGVRIMMLDVTYDGDQTMLCHGPCNLGSMPHLDGLAELHDFLIANPREVFTIIYQDSISVEDMEADWVESGMIDMVFAHEAGSAWPTLGEMIDAGTRVVVTAEAGGPPPAWFHHVWDEAWDTGYSWTSTDEMTCDLNRGSTDNDLYLVNHWVSTALGTPSEADAAASNSFEVLHARLQQCWSEAGQIPNFVAVDFYEDGDLFEAVAALNGLAP